MLDIFLAPDNIYLSWNTIDNTSYLNNLVKFKIKLWYKPEYKIIEFDRRTWKIQVN
jgi:hypothetical protein